MPERPSFTLPPDACATMSTPEPLPLKDLATRISGALGFDVLVFRK